MMGPTNETKSLHVTEDGASKASNTSRKAKVLFVSEKTWKSVTIYFVYKKVIVQGKQPARKIVVLGKSIAWGKPSLHRY